MRLKTFVLLMFGYVCLAQNNTHQQIETVFNQLVLAFGSAKPAPKWELIKKVNYPVPPASYVSQPYPTIKIDEKLYTLCQSFEKDSLNALAIIISHELTHYYNDHTYCSDFAFSHFRKHQPQLTANIKNASIQARLEKETEADIKGFFYAAAAGFKPFGLQAQLIDKIYSHYGLPDVQKGYPSKHERKQIAISADAKAKELFGYFEQGLSYLENKNYTEAIQMFEKANSEVAFRENWHNIGVAKTRWALTKKTASKAEITMPNRFLYPIEVENKSRLNNEQTRTLDDHSQWIMTLLKEAQKDFEKALLLDPSFHKSRINLACVYDLQGKHLSAIAEITEKLPENIKNTPEAQRILAIAYYHADMEEHAESIWMELKL